MEGHLLKLYQDLGKEEKYIHIIYGGALCGLSGAFISIVYVPTWHLVADVEDSETTTPAAYEPEITLTTPKWTGDSDIVFEVDAKGGAVYPQEMYVYGADDTAMPIISVPSRVEVNEEGKGKVTFTNDALKNATTWDDTFTNQISVDWTKYSKIEFVFAFELNGQDKYKSMYVETSVKAPAPTVTPTTPTKPAKPSENKGTTTKTTTSTKKEAPKTTGDTMNVALYASLLLVSALAAVVLTTKKRITE